MFKRDLARITGSQLSLRPDKTRTDLRKALQKTVDSGLMYLGYPPVDHPHKDWLENWEVFPFREIQDEKKNLGGLLKVFGLRVRQDGRVTPRGSNHSIFDLAAVKVGLAACAGVLGGFMECRFQGKPWRWVLDDTGFHEVTPSIAWNVTADTRQDLKAEEVHGYVHIDVLGVPTTARPALEKKILELYPGLDFENECGPGDPHVHVHGDRLTWATDRLSLCEAARTIRDMASKAAKKPVLLCAYGVLHEEDCEDRICIKEFDDDDEPL